MLSQNGPDFWFPGGAGHWQKCPIVRDVPSSTYQILAQIAWSVNFLSSVLLPRNRKKGRCCHKMARISGFQVVLGIDKNVRLSEMFLLPHTKFWPKLHGPLIFYLVFSFPGTGKRVDAVTKWPGFLVSRWRWALTKMSDCQRCSFFTYQILAQIAWSVNFLSSVLLPRNRKKGRCCHKMARISGFQVALGIDKNVRLSEMFLLPHTKFWPKLHGPLIFYLVFSFPGTGKRVDAVTKWPGFLVSRWRWALTKMSDCQRCSFFHIPNFGPNCMVR